jgi:hypothetical protein
MGISCILWSDFVRIQHLVAETVVPQTSEGPWLVNNGKLANPWTITHSDERHCSSLDISQRAVSLRLTCLPSSLSSAVLARQVLKCNWSRRCTREHLSKWLKNVKAVSTVWGNIINMYLGADCGEIFYDWKHCHALAWRRRKATEARDGFVCNSVFKNP